MVQADNGFLLYPVLVRAAAELISGVEKHVDWYADAERRAELRQAVEFLIRYFAAVESEGQPSVLDDELMRQRLAEVRDKLAALDRGGASPV